MARREPRAQSRELDTRVEVQNPPAPDSAATQNDFGEITPATWTAVRTAWAKVIPEAGGEITVGNQPVGQQRFRVRLRRCTDLATKQRLKVLSGLWRNAYLVIEAFAPPAGTRGELTEVICVRTGG